ncbi:MAG: bifunctional DNA-formamidopyrimidine glycosylase/DNA-(apurinic or apyrimidinic site) lyase [Candidatus Pacebacteria bacterium]|nr:bifunctional DNA-formamidopyrimidine glycosylase/DNA-(apurinic or apyrimidinic site) lyase [Candidatus Paceibacterota bacterium]
MPELPEVENLRLGLERVIVGQKIKSVKVEKPKLVSGKGTKRSPSQKKKLEFIKGLIGEKFLAVERRAKNLVFKLSHNKIIIVHLKMSGQFSYKPFKKGKQVSGGHPIELSETELPNKHTHVTFELEKGMLYYNDTRMFGYLLYYPNTEAFEDQNHFSSYGVEPTSREFTLHQISHGLFGKKGKIKTVLMDQKIVTGLGNIYADESLFESKIRPDRSPATLSKPEIQKLHKAIVRIITRAIKVGGSSVATYKLLDESEGNYAREHKVYGKSGKPCVNCNKPLTKTVVGGRTTIFCPKCQK